MIVVVYQRQHDAWQCHPESTRHSILKLIRSQISEFQQEQGLQQEEEPTKGYEDSNVNTLNYFLMQQLTESEWRQQQCQILGTSFSVVVDSSKGLDLSQHENID